MHVKAFNSDIRKAGTVEASGRVRTFRITTGSVDRMGDTIDPAGWQVENFKAAGGPVLWAHRHDEPPIGKAIDLRTTRNGLEADVEFAPKDVYPFADTVLGLIDFGALKATSVGFN